MKRDQREISENKIGVEHRPLYFLVLYINNEIHYFFSSIPFIYIISHRVCEGLIQYSYINPGGDISPILVGHSHSC